LLDIVTSIAEAVRVHKQPHEILCVAYLTKELLAERCSTESHPKIWLQ